MRIKSYDGLRFFFAITIFLNHCTFLKDTKVGDVIFESFLHNGRYGVTFFFLLSAFLMYKKYQSIELWTVRSYVSFVRNKVARIYPLYMMTMIYVAIWELVISHTDIKLIVSELLLSATMMQSLTLKYWGILNSVSWYLSSLFFMYLVMPLLLYVAKAIKQKNILLVMFLLLGSVFAEDIVIQVLLRERIINDFNGMLIGYVWPIYWIPTYLLGMLLCKFCENRKKSFGSVHEFLALTLCIVAYLLGLNGPDYIVKYKAVLYVASICILLMVIYFGNGLLSSALNKISSIGKYSDGIYLIHYVLIYFGLFQLIDRYNSYGFAGNMCEVAIIFIITLLLSVLWNRITVTNKKIKSITDLQEKNSTKL